MSWSIGRAFETLGENINSTINFGQDIGRSIIYVATNLEESWRDSYVTVAANAIGSANIWMIIRKKLAALLGSKLRAQPAS